MKPLHGIAARCAPLFYAAALCILALPAAAAPPAASPGITDSEISIGISVPLSGPVGKNGSEFLSGATMVFDRVNAAGGIFGRKIAPLALDDGYQAQRTAANVRTLVEEKHVFAIFGVLGTDNAVEGLKIATPAGVPFLFPVTGDDGMRREPNRYLFTLSASLPEEMDKIVEHLLTVGIRRIAVAHFDNGFGRSLLAATERSMKKRNTELVAAVPFAVNAKDAPAAAQKLIAAKPAAIILASLGKSSADFIEAYRKAGGDAAIYSFSGVGSDQLVARLGAGSRGIVISQNMPSPWSFTQAASRDYRALKTARKEKDYSYLSMRGYISATVLVEALKRAGKSPTRDGLVTAIESMQHMDIGGFPIDFSREQHNGAQFVELTVIGANGVFVQ